MSGNDKHEVHKACSAVENASFRGGAPTRMITLIRICMICCLVLHQIWRDSHGISRKNGIESQGLNGRCQFLRSITLLSSVMAL